MKLNIHLQYLIYFLFVLDAIYTHVEYYVYVRNTTASLYTQPMSVQTEYTKWLITIQIFPFDLTKYVQRLLIQIYCHMPNRLALFIRCFLSSLGWKQLYILLPMIKRSIFAFNTRMKCLRQLIYELRRTPH